jgi:hypothetical protein
MADFPANAFTLFSTFNTSKDIYDKAGNLVREAKPGEYWAKSEWPIEQINALYAWANSEAALITTNQKGEACVTVSQKLLPRTSKAGNEYLLGVTSDPAPVKPEDLF